MSGFLEFRKTKKTPGMLAWQGAQLFKNTFYFSENPNQKLNLENATYRIQSDSYAMRQMSTHQHLFTHVGR